MILMILQEWAQFVRQAIGGSDLFRRVAAVVNRPIAAPSPLVYHWARQAGLQASDAQDVVQETFRTVPRQLMAFAAIGQATVSAAGCGQ